MFVSTTLRTGLVYLIALQGMAQTLENFADGDFTTNPTWVGDVSSFEVLSGELHLNAAPVSGASALIVPSVAMEDATWEFTVRLAFNPSSSNFVNVYLTSDQPNLAGPLNGYFVRIGGTSDEVSLYRKLGSSETELIDGLDGRVNADPVLIRVKVSRDDSGNWTLFSDPGITGTFVQEGSAQDESILLSLWFGFHCVYTSTRSEAFYFDDVEVSGGPVTDRTPPQLDSAEVLSRQSIGLWFSEPLNMVKAGDEANFSLSASLASPLLAAVHPGGYSVELTFANEFSNGIEFDLTVKDLEDEAGNLMADTVVALLYYEPAPLAYRDLAITEIFADPSPSVGMPAAEFLEILNRSDHPIRIKDWRLQDLSTEAVLPDHILQPGDLVIVTSSGASNLYANYGTTLGITGFPTLNNDGDVVIIRTESSQLVDSVNYSLEWYGDEDKEQGGFSLELIDPGNPCAEKENWTASESPLGGTPGIVNSVNANKPDLTPPAIVGVVPSTPTLLRIVFNEKLDPAAETSAIVSLYTDQCTPSVLTTANARFTSTSLQEIVVDLSSSLESGVAYRLVVEGVSDCNGNNLEMEECEDYYEFGRPEDALPGDLLVNEVLFNPYAGGVDFIEVVNASAKFINLRNAFFIGESEQSIIKDDLIIAPGELYAFTSDPQVLLSQYFSSDVRHIVKQALPAMPDAEGTIQLRTADSVLSDSFDYWDDLHSIFIKDAEGVSLERISLSDSSLLHSNWASASSMVGYATPGVANSQKLETSSVPGEVLVYPEVFEPVTGVPPYTQITYNFSTGGWTGNVKVYDVSGRMVKTIAMNELMGNEGFFRWVGDRDDGSKARVGAYIVWFEVFSSSGSVSTFLKRVIVGTSK